MGRVTIEDLARECGCSTATVSRVLNKKGVVSEKLRLEIERAVAKLGYVPNPLARSMASGTSYFTGMIIPQLGNPYLSSLINALERKLAPSGIFLNIANSHNSFDQEKLNIQRLLNWHMGALIITDGNEEGFNSGYYEWLGQRVPLIFVSELKDVNRKFICVGTDIADGIKRAIRLLRYQKHRRIGLITGTYQGSNLFKKQFFLQELAFEGIETRENDVVLLDHFNDHECFEELKRKFSDTLISPDAPTAVIAGNELIAMAMVRLCHLLRLRIPEDISLISFDNTVFSQYVTPPITSIDINVDHIAGIVAERIERIIFKGEYEPEHLFFPSDLIIRESTRSL